MNQELLNELSHHFPDEFTDKNVAKADAEYGVVVYLKAKDHEDKPFWSFLVVPPSKMFDFKIAEAQGEYNPNDYGDVLDWGWGEKPPVEKIEEMKEKYGVDLKFEEKAREMFKSYMVTKLEKEQEEKLMARIEELKREEQGE